MDNNNAYSCLWFPVSKPHYFHGIAQLAFSPLLCVFFPIMPPLFSIGNVCLRRPPSEFGRDLPTIAVRFAREPHPDIPTSRRNLCMGSAVPSAPPPCSHLRFRMRWDKRRLVLSEGPPLLQRKEKPVVLHDRLFMESGDELSFRAVTSQVLSTRRSLTSVFGMGTGGTFSP